MWGHRIKRKAARKRSQARRKRTFKLTVPVSWGQDRQMIQGPSLRSRTKMQAVSWRTRLGKLIEALLKSPRWASLLLLLAVGVAFYLVGASTLYYVEEVEVLGLNTLSRSAVLQASGLDGMHVFWINPAHIARRVANFPGVLTATVTVDLPNTVSIAVSERAPVIAWDQAGDRFWVDEDGRLMQARQESAGLVVILSQELEKLELGDMVPTEVMEGALQLRRERPNIESLYYERGVGLSYQDGRNWRAYFGTGKDMNQKLAIYETLIADLRTRDLKPEYVSVINKEKPFYHLAAPRD